MYNKWRNARSQWYRKNEFIPKIFDSKQEYESLVTEFDESPITEIRNEALEEFRRENERVAFGGVRLTIGRDYYALVRKLEPDTVVETGVCNGISTLCILLALERNGTGKLHAIDYPYRSDQPLETFQDATFHGYGGAAIPVDKEPGWLIPEEFQHRLLLKIGKSQRELPKLVSSLEEIDVFVHDSEHSLPCMLFEYELAWEWLSQGGVILSDDINHNEAFNSFQSARQPEYGRIATDVGFMIRKC